MYNVCVISIGIRNASAKYIVVCKDRGRGVWKVHCICTCIICIHSPPTYMYMYIGTTTYKTTIYMECDRSLTRDDKPHFQDVRTLLFFAQAASARVL